MRLSHPRIQHLQFLLFLAIAAVACTDPSDPATITARFVLTDINGQQLPYTPPATAGSQPATILSGSLTLNNSGIAILEESQLNSAGGTTSVASRFRYRIAGATIEFSFETPCTQGICAMLPTGELLDNGIHAQIGWPPQPSTVVYRYVVSGSL